MTDNNIDTIHSIPEYLKYLESIETIAGTTYTLGCFTFYRGQANINWGLTPSLYRQKLLKMENLLLRELNHLCPLEFMNNRFDTLVKMQHFGLPTRLLDTTTNPLVALYFACESQNEFESDAAVYIFPNLPVAWSTDPIIELMMDYVFGDMPRGISLEKMLEITVKKYAHIVNRAMPNNVASLLVYLTIPLFAVMPAKTNDRIEAQDGAFFICGMKLCEENTAKKTESKKYSFEPIDAIDHHRVCSGAKKLRIPASAKKDILKNLDLLGINKRKLFPDLTHQIEYAVNFVKSSYPKSLL